MKLSQHCPNRVYHPTKNGSGQGRAPLEGLQPKQAFSVTHHYRLSTEPSLPQRVCAGFSIGPQWRLCLQQEFLMSFVSKGVKPY